MHASLFSLSHLTSTHTHTHTHWLCEAPPSPLAEPNSLQLCSKSAQIHDNASFVGNQRQNRARKRQAGGKFLFGGGLDLSFGGYIVTRLRVGPLLRLLTCSLLWRVLIGRSHLHHIKHAEVCNSCAFRAHRYKSLALGISSSDSDDVCVKKWTRIFQIRSSLLFKGMDRLTPVRYPVTSEVYPADMKVNKPGGQRPAKAFCALQTQEWLDSTILQVRIIIIWQRQEPRTLPVLERQNSTVMTVRLTATCPVVPRAGGRLPDTTALNTAHRMPTPPPYPKTARKISSRAHVQVNTKAIQQRANLFHSTPGWES